jgi:hypothetical protein
MRTFYLTTHMSNWLWSGQVPEDVALFVSHRRLASRKSVFAPATVKDWALDSGGFTELQMYGEWRTTPTEYVAAVRRYDEEIGNLSWAAPQDWMCEDAIINGGTFGPIRFAGTHLSVAQHQRRTVDNFVELSDLWNDDFTNPFMPALQGDDRDSYLRCWDLYDRAGIDLANYPIIGLGSVCRRQHEDEIGDIVSALLERDHELPIHGFGVKKQGLLKYGHLLTTADSLAWSKDARHAAPLDGCESHINCANCVRYALRWRDQVLQAVAA